MKAKAYTHDGQQKNLELCEEGFKQLQSAMRGGRLRPTQEAGPHSEPYIHTSVDRHGVWHASYLLASDLKHQVLCLLGYDVDNRGGVAVKYLLTGRTYLHQQLSPRDEWDLRLEKLPRPEQLKITVGKAKLAKAHLFPELCARLGIQVGGPADVGTSTLLNRADEAKRKFEEKLAALEAERTEVERDLKRLNELTEYEQLIRKAGVL